MNTLEKARETAQKLDGSTFDTGEATTFADKIASERVAEAMKELREKLEPILSGGQPYGKLRKQEFEKDADEYDLSDDAAVPTRTAWMLGFDACSDVIRKVLSQVSGD